MPSPEIDRLRAAHTNNIKAAAEKPQTEKVRLSQTPANPDDMPSNAKFYRETGRRVK